MSTIPGRPWWRDYLVAGIASLLVCIPAGLLVLHLMGRF